MGDLWFRQEYLCEFVDAVSGVFDRGSGGKRDHGRGQAAGVRLRKGDEDRVFRRA